MAQSLFFVVVLARTEIFRSELIARRDGASPQGRFKSDDISSSRTLPLCTDSWRPAFCESFHRNTQKSSNIRIKIIELEAISSNLAYLLYVSIKLILLRDIDCDLRKLFYITFQKRIKIVAYMVLTKMWRHVKIGHCVVIFIKEIFVYLFEIKSRTLSTMLPEFE